MLNYLNTVVLGIIQGITEWLPISSTGHMILANEFIKLDVSREFWKMFLVVIQFGSILAVVTLYFNKLNPFKKDRLEAKQTLTLWAKVIVGVIPAAIAGLILDDFIPEQPFVVALALIVYGILFIIIENRKTKPKVTSLDGVTYKKALEIGLCQCLSLIPGTSRSGSTILGAAVLGCSRNVAAEYSFFLAIPVMLGASLLRIVKFFLEGNSFSGGEFSILITGTVSAYLVSIGAIKFLMGYIRKHNFKAFGYYRIVLGIIVILYTWLK